METTINNLCNSCTNTGCVFQSGIVRTKCAFYMPPLIEPDNCGNYIVMQPTVVEIIPKADYKARLKADMVAMLDKLKAEIESYKLSEDELSDMDEDSIKWGMAIAYDIVEKAAASCRTWEDLDGSIQNKINTLEEE